MTVHLNFQNTMGYRLGSHLCYLYNYCELISLLVYNILSDIEWLRTWFHFNNLFLSEITLKFYRIINLYTEE